MSAECQNPASCPGVWKWSLLTEKLLISVALSGHVCKHSCTTCSIVNKKMKFEKGSFSKNPHCVLLCSDSGWNLITVNSWVLILIQVSQNSAGYWEKPQQIANSWMCSQPTWFTIKSTKNISISSKFLSKPQWMKNLIPLCWIS